MTKIDILKDVALATLQISRGSMFYHSLLLNLVTSLILFSFLARDLIFTMCVVCIHLKVLLETYWNKKDSKQSKCSSPHNSTPENRNSHHLFLSIHSLEAHRNTRVSQSYPLLGARSAPASPSWSYIQHCLRVPDYSRCFYIQVLCGFQKEWCLPPLNHGYICLIELCPSLLSSVGCSVFSHLTNLRQKILHFQQGRWEVKLQYVPWLWVWFQFDT